MADDNSITFFSGVKLCEPGEGFEKEVHRVLNDTVGKWLKRVSLGVLVGRIALNGYMNLQHVAFSPSFAKPHESLKSTQDFEERARRVSSGICNALTDSAERKACAEDLFAVASKWDVDVGLRYSVSAQLVYSSERGFYCVNALGFVFFCLSSTFLLLFRGESESDAGFNAVIASRKYAKRIAGFSALKALLYLNLPFLSLTWKSEWLHGIRAIYVTPGEDTGFGGHPLARRQRAFITIVSMVTAIGGILLAFTAFQVKVLEHQHLLYMEQRDWSWYEWYQFLNLLNIVMSIFDTEQITYNRAMLFAFGGKDAKIDVKEYEKKQAYEVRILRAARKKFGILDFFTIAYQYDSGDLQQIMMADSAAEGDDPEDNATEDNVNAELMRDMKDKPARMIMLGVIAAGLAGSIVARHYMQINSK